MKEDKNLFDENFIKAKESEAKDFAKKLL